jgi:hypothetical protein
MELEQPDYFTAYHNLKLTRGRPCQVNASEHSAWSSESTSRMNEGRCIASTYVWMLLE